jgi:hypothetical protein
MTPSGKFVGIDVSKAQFDVAVRPTGEHWTSAHTEARIDLAPLTGSRSSVRVGPNGGPSAPSPSYSRTDSRQTA